MYSCELKCSREESTSMQRLCILASVKGQVKCMLLSTPARHL
jgi:hypothetical protein